MNNHEMRQWLTERVAYYLDKPIESVESNVELAAYGIDSVYALSVISDIEDRLGIEVDTAAIRNHPTVDAITDYLATVETTGGEVA